MNLRKPRRRPTRQRITVPLTGTTKSTPAHLHFGAELALIYAAAFLFRAGRVKVPASGIMRAALVAYAARLDAADEASLFREAQTACMASPVAHENRRAAELRLYSVPPDEPLPPFGAILRGHASRQLAEQATLRADTLADGLLRGST
jgi:hypothetical protein